LSRKILILIDIFNVFYEKAKVFFFSNRDIFVRGVLPIWANDHILSMEN